MSVSYRAQTARVTGARHVRAGEMCQDAALCGVRGELAFYGLADGQSGARFGLEGAQAALTVIRDYIGRRGLTLLASYVYTDEIQYELAQLLRRELRRLSRLRGAAETDFGSTAVVFAVCRRTGRYMTVHIAAEEESAPIESDFLPCIRELVSQPEEDERTVAALYVNGAISAKKCRAVAGDILLDNLNRSFSDQTDKAKAYHVIAVRPDGQMTVSGGINASRTRVQDLLAGKAEVEKSDMLYLLWFTVGLCWLWNSRPRPSEIYDRLADFIDAAEICLDAAMLPPFYPPHLIEQSMLLSVVYAGRTESDTAEIYEQLCSAVIERRKSKNRP